MTPPESRDRTSHPLPQSSVSLGRHQRNCIICRHPDCRWIEQDFLHWRSPYEICQHYDLSDRALVYRHAHALGLFVLRKRKLRSALEFVIERAEYVKPSANGLVCAIRAYTRLTDDGEWIDTPNRTIITHETVSVHPKQSEAGARERRPSVGHPTGRTIPPGGPASAPPEESAADDSENAGSGSATEYSHAGQAEGASSFEDAREGVTPEALTPQALTIDPREELSSDAPPSEHPADSPGYKFAELVTPLMRQAARTNAQLEAARSHFEAGGDD
ncbi:MAG: hypothetical protein WBC04_15380 [Candidatus Acidiferrales bacterium]